MTPKNYDLTFHYFRAFAIVSVMLTHMWVGPVLAGSEDAAKLQDSLRLCLFHSATIYFVFISGYLFDFVNRRKGQFSPLRFYKSKIVNVFCPYFILSLLLLAAAGSPTTGSATTSPSSTTARPWPPCGTSCAVWPTGRPVWCPTGTSPSS